MTTPAPCDRIAALRDEIRRAAGSTGELRRVLRIYTPLAVILLWFLSGAPCSSVADLYWIFGGIAVYPLLVGPGIVVGYRLRRRALLRRKLSSLPPGEQASVLLPLQSGASGDTRKLVQPPIRKLRVPA